MAFHRIKLFEPESSLHKYRLEIGLSIVGLLLLSMGVVGAYGLVHSYDNRFYPTTTIDSLPVSGMTVEEARQKISSTTKVPDYTITLTSGKSKVASHSGELGLTKDIDASIQKALKESHQQSLGKRVSRLLGWRAETTQVTSSWHFDQAAVTQAILALQAASTTLPEPPTAELTSSNKDATLKIYSGKEGQAINVDKALKLINLAAVPTSQGAIQVASASTTVDLSTTQENIGHQLTVDEMTQFQARAKKFVGKSIAFAGDDQKRSVNDQVLVAWLAYPDGYRTDLITKTVKEWQSQMTRPAQNAVLEYDKTSLTVKNFIPPQNGLTLDTNQTISLIENDLQKFETSDDKHFDEKLALTIAQPDKLLSSTNDLGINEQIGFGESQYFHSIPSRIHNVQITSQRLNNQLVAPGAEFSFNQAIGDVSAATGYQPAYIIKDGATVLGDGGGVCQVSSTLFRALLNGGLKITRRLPHSYRVSYYELNSQPGFDATVYSGNVDLRFVNDTGHYLLIHSEADSKNLYMKVTLWGTSDGRTTEIKDYTKSASIPAPAPIYAVDPTLPHGVTKQVDFAAAGIKTSFTNVIKDKNGNVIREDTYKSNYIPWAAKYLTGP